MDEPMTEDMSRYSDTVRDKLKEVVQITGKSMSEIIEAYEEIYAEATRNPKNSDMSETEIEGYCGRILFVREIMLPAERREAQDKLDAQEAQAKERAITEGTICAICGCSAQQKVKSTGEEYIDPIQSHHTSYFPEITTPLCRGCHMTVHVHPEQYPNLVPPPGHAKAFYDRHAPTPILLREKETITQTQYYVPSTMGIEEWCQTHQDLHVVKDFLEKFTDDPSHHLILLLLDILHGMADSEKL